MSIKAGVGSSKVDDSFEAGLEAVKVAFNNAGLDKADAVVVFSSVSMDQEEVVRGVREGAGDAQLVGCSSAGEITNGGSISSSVAVMVIQSDSAKFKAGIGLNIGKGAMTAASEMFADVTSDTKESPKAIIMLPDVLVGNGAEVVRGVQEVAGKDFLIVGGAAGDDFLFKQTYEYCNDKVFSGAVAGLGIFGEFTAGVGVRHGWVPIGIPMKVTKSEGSVLHELDNRPAVSIYEDYFGEKAENLKKEPLARMAITYPIGVKISELEEYLIRDPITVNDGGSITCAAEIPEGAEVRLMIGSKDKAIEAARDAANKLMQDFESVNSKPDLVLMFNCIAREKLFGQRAGDEINAVLDVIGRDTPLLGFYTYGEVAPYRGAGKDNDKFFSRFYNETMVLFGLGSSS